MDAFFLLLCNSFKELQALFAVCFTLICISIVKFDIMFPRSAIFIILVSFLLVPFQLFPQNQFRIDSLRSALERQTDSKTKAELLLRLSREYDDVNANQLTYAEQAYQNAEQSEDLDGMAEALALQGFYYYGQLRNQALSKPFFDRSLSLSRSSSTNELYAKMCLLIGTYINASSPSGAAKPYLLQAYSMYRLLRNRANLAVAAKELSLVYAASRQKDSALFYSSEYGAYSRSLSDDFQLADWYALSSRLYGEFFNDANKQIEFFKLAATIYDRLLEKGVMKKQVCLAYARLHASKSKTHWLKNQLSDLRANSMQVLKLCDLMDQQGQHEREIYELRWAAYASLIRACISAKDEAASLYYIREGSDFFNKRKDFYHYAKLLWSVESSYWRFTEFTKAYKYQLSELEAWDRVGNTYWRCIALANQAMVFGRLGDLQRQIDCIQQLLVLSKATNVTAFTLYASKDLAKSYFLLGRIDSARLFIDRAAKLNEENENPFISMVIDYIKALLSEKQGHLDEAINLLTKARDIKIQYAYPTNTYDQVAPESALARIYLAAGDCKRALEMGRISLEMSKKENMKDMLATDYITLAGVYKQMRDYAHMAECLEKNIELTAELAKNDAEKTIHKMEISNINKRNDLERALLLKENVLRQAQLHIQQVWIWGATLACFALAFFVYFLFKGYRRKIADNLLLSEQKAEISEKNDELKQLNEEVSSQRDHLFALNEQITVQHDEIYVQNEMIIRQQKDITGSIVYASRIQQAMIPSLEALTSNFPHSFVLFLPRDIVSGDFYWVRQVRNQLYLLVADCTGHGVPGAFMSMLGISLMNEMITSRHIDAPAVVLNELRKRLKRSLHQDESSSDSKDGMDASLVLIDLDTRKLQFAGAYNPLYLIRRSSPELLLDQLPSEMEKHSYEFIELFADRMPIGIHPNDEKSFTNQTMWVERGDRLYLFSDGYVSQFGGEKGGKFKTKQFKELLLNIQAFGMDVQHEMLFSAYEQWRGNQWSQVDDILVLGFEV